MSAIERAVADADWLRRSPAARGGDGGHKEWWHFCVYAPGVDVLVNFSLVDDVRPGCDPAREFARLVVLVREREWDGDVEVFESAEVEAAGGGLHMRFGDNRVAFEGGRYVIEVRLQRRPIAVSLVLAPRCVPSLANNIRLDPGPPINWLVLPRMVASGTLTLGGRTVAVERASAYHDHNWGHFAWGRDFAWEWGYGLPEGDDANPWSMVFVRLSDRAHTRAYMQALFLWRGALQHRVWRAADVSVERVGLLRASRVFKLPRVMSLVAPGTVTDVPRALVVRARGDGDEVECRFDAEDVAAVVIPNDHDPGVTVIHEVSGVVSVTGRVRGEALAMRGRAIFEFLGA
ncbi:MAG: hypothetical protein JWM10_4918 [Myxococcaceae bacterium]|nr:hypothetical protein [Myxococcaceae bacterium]